MDIVVSFFAIFWGDLKYELFINATGNRKPVRILKWQEVTFWKEVSTSLPLQLVCQFLSHSYYEYMP